MLSIIIIMGRIDIPVPSEAIKHNLPLHTPELGTTTYKYRESITLKREKNLGRLKKLQVRWIWKGEQESVLEERYPRRPSID